MGISTIGTQIKRFGSSSPQKVMNKNNEFGHENSNKLKGVICQNDSMLMIKKTLECLERF